MLSCILIFHFTGLRYLIFFRCQLECFWFVRSKSHVNTIFLVMIFISVCSQFLAYIWWYLFIYIGLIETLYQIKSTNHSLKQINKHTQSGWRKLGICKRKEENNLVFMPNKGGIRSFFNLYQCVPVIQTLGRTHP